MEETEKNQKYKEKSFFEIIILAFKIYKKNFLSILIIGLSVFLPVAAIQVYLVDSSLDLNYILKMLQSENEISSSLQSSLVNKYLLYMIVTLALSLIIVIANLAIIKIANAHIKEEKITPFDAFNEAIILWPKALVTLIIYSLLVICGMFFFIIPGIYIFIIMYFSTIVVALTGLWGRKALAYSSVISTSKIGKIFGYLILVIALQTIIPMFLDKLISLINLNDIWINMIEIMALILTDFISGFFIIMMTVLFINISEGVNPETTKKFFEKKEKIED